MGKRIDLKLEVSYKLDLCLIRYFAALSGMKDLAEAEKEEDVIDYCISCMFDIYFDVEKQIIRVPLSPTYTTGEYLQHLNKWLLKLETVRKQKSEKDKKAAYYDQLATHNKIELKRMMQPAEVIEGWDDLEQNDIYSLYIDYLEEEGIKDKKKKLPLSLELSEVRYKQLLHLKGIMELSPKETMTFSEAVRNLISRTHYQMASLSGGTELRIPIAFMELKEVEKLYEMLQCSLKTAEQRGAKPEEISKLVLYSEELERHLWCIMQEHLKEQGRRWIYMKNQ